MEPKAWWAEPCIVGVDEAGRGSVMGPMVYAVAACPVAYKDTLVTRQYDDSKALTAAKREALLNKIRADPELAWEVDAISAQHISAQMLAPCRKSLNEIAVQSTLQLLRGLQAKGINVVEVYVDTVGDPERYQARLAREIPGVAFTVCPKADSIYPIVSAASIAAKVTRDEMQAGIAGEGGSGYPGDAVTREWLQERTSPVFGLPPDVRFSWQPVTKLLEQSAVSMTFEADAEDAAQPALTFATPSSKACSSAVDRHSFFRTRRLQAVEAGMW